VQTYQHPTLGDVRYTPSPTKFDGWQAPRGAAPSLGEHTADVLRDRLGLDDEAIADLAQRSVIRTTSPA
jgi:crotonobetainyl-CoA:carnitine CoA-transferase CaiB-like acyl-CoA transferase